MKAAPKGRGATHNPPNRFEKINLVPDEEFHDDPRPLKTQFFKDSTQSIISYNNSPDIGFRASLNPYRGCEHGCAYCYARPTHEYLGFSAGIDFESKIMVKEDASKLLQQELENPKWIPQSLSMSGVTDPYQPIERKLEISRRCLEILAEYRNPVGIVTKNHLVTRDIDHLGKLAKFQACRVFLSITSLRPDFARLLEPRAASPEHRLDALRELNAAGIPTGVMIAPVIPGLNDHEIPEILKAAYSAGARCGGYVVLRLPYAVAPLFEAWLDRHFPGHKQKVLERLKSIRNGKLYQADWETRMTGKGFYAEQIAQLFEVGFRKAGFPESVPSLSTKHFRRRTEQLQLF